MSVSELQPKEVFSIFHEITQVPRPSKREGKIIEWLKAFAVKHNLEHTVDEAPIFQENSDITRAIYQECFALPSGYRL